MFSTTKLFCIGIKPATEMGEKGDKAFICESSSSLSEEGTDNSETTHLFMFLFNFSESLIYTCMLLPFTF